MHFATIVPTLGGSIQMKHIQAFLVLFEALVKDNLRIKRTKMCMRSAHV